MTSISDPSSTSADATLAQVYRSDWGRLLSLLVTRSRRLDLAEDALGEAFARAARTWRNDDVPANPAAWLYTSAWRQLIGYLRSEAIAGRKSHLLAVDERLMDGDSGADSGNLDDDRLVLILLCCHPALHPHARSALSLRLVVGTSTAEIARLFLVSTPTMAARLTRAKKKIAVAGIPLAAPVGIALQRRLTDVCRTVYLAFTAGYTPGEGDQLLRTDLAGEAVHLAQVLHRLVPDDRQVRYLYSLLLLQHARRDARVDNGRLVTLGEQDRDRWHSDEIDAGIALLDPAPTAGYGEQLRIQALIAAEHARAASADETRWSAISGLYRRLEELTASPVVRLNRAVAVGEAEDPLAALQLLTTIESQLAGSHRFHAVQADLHRRAGNTAAAKISYAKALEYCSNTVERDHLKRQSQTLTDSS